MSNQAYTFTAVATIIVLVIAIITVSQSMYRVDESQYALELRIGEVKNIRLNPGLYTKIPFIDSIQRIDRRTLRADIPPREIPDKNRERLIIDIVVRYQITDPLQFRKTLRNEATALERLKDITYSATRDTIAQHDRTDVIGARPKTDEQGNLISGDDGTTLYESLVHTRDQISQDIEDRIAHTVTNQQYGITVISADIKRADYPEQVRSSIVDRLRAERARVAAKHRADGEEAYRRHTADIQKQADILIAEAERDARETKGEGDAESIRIIQEALTQNPEFYRFIRTLESYEKSIQNGATIVMTEQPDGYLYTLTNPPTLTR